MWSVSLSIAFLVPRTAPGSYSLTGPIFSKGKLRHQVSTSSLPQKSSSQECAPSSCLAVWCPSQNVVSGKDRQACAVYERSEGLRILLAGLLALSPVQGRIGMPQTLRKLFLLYLRGGLLFFCVCHDECPWRG